jgi:hypothetical protein
LCMFHALEQQLSYTEPFKKYMLRQLAIPAERIRLVCSGS